jgi:hypothetical protein
VDTLDPHFIAGYMSSVWEVGLGDSSSLPGWVEKAQKAFPSVNLFEEARKAHLWEASRPSRKKKDIRRFLTNWWSKAQTYSEKRGEGGGVVVSIDSMRWLKRANRAPEKTLSRWLKGKGGLSPELIQKFCSYYGVPLPNSSSSVIEMYEGSKR